MSDPAYSEAEAERRIAVDGRDVEALLAKADHRFAALDRRAAASFYAAAIQAAQAGSPHDPAEIRRAIAQGQEIERGILPHLIAELAAAGHSQRDWHPRFAAAVAIMAGQRQRPPSSAPYPQTPTAYYHPGLPEREFADPSEFAWRDRVEAAFPEIRKEGMALLEADGRFAPYVRHSATRPQGDVHGMLENRDWSTFELTDSGRPVAERVALCPQTYETISDNAPLCDIPNRAPSIMFSLLTAGRRIPPHTGMINARLICHLPLVVPGAGALRVGTSSRSWEEGRLLVFDDSVEHDARNHADLDRLVLIFDIWHPDLEPVEQAQIRALFHAVDTY